MALNIENIIAEIKEASILELNDLVKAIEEEFGVTAISSPLSARNLNSRFGTYGIVYSS